MIGVKQQDILEEMDEEMNEEMNEEMKEEMKEEMNVKMNDEMNRVLAEPLTCTRIASVSLTKSCGSGLMSS